MLAIKALGIFLLGGFLWGVVPLWGAKSQKTINITVRILPRISLSLSHSQRRLPMARVWARHQSFSMIFVFSLLLEGEDDRAPPQKGPLPPMADQVTWCQVNPAVQNNGALCWAEEY